MKHITYLLFIFLSLMTSYAYAGSIVVIVNKDNSQSLTKAQLKDIYTDKVTTWNDGNRIIKLFELPARSTSREKFSQEILGMSAKESARFWANKKITNTARNLPSKKRESSVVRSVSRNPDAIGYVSKEAAEGNSDVRVILTIE